jgi:hypothetical protein
MLMNRLRSIGAEARQANIGTDRGVTRQCNYAHVVAFTAYKGGALVLLSGACVSVTWRGASALNIAPIGTPLRFFRG